MMWKAQLAVSIAARVHCLGAESILRIHLFLLWFSHSVFHFPSCIFMQLRQNMYVNIFLHFCCSCGAEAGPLCNHSWQVRDIPEKVRLPLYRKPIVPVRFFELFQTFEAEPISSGSPVTLDHHSIKNSLQHLETAEVLGMGREGSGSPTPAVPAAQTHRRASSSAAGKKKTPTPAGYARALFQQQFAKASLF